MTCAKKVVSCIIETPDGRVFYGRNDCENPQKECPRNNGEGYEKCKTICQQVGHAEEIAIKNAKGHDLTGAKATLYGIGFYCKECQKSLFTSGVKYLTLGE